MIREEMISQELLTDKDIDNNYYLTEPEEENDYNHFKYDLVLKSNSEKILCLIEAKYRSSSGRPTTDSIVASLIKLLYEWCTTFKKNLEIKLVLLIYLKDGVSEPDETFRNGIIEKLNELAKDCFKIENNFRFEMITIKAVKKDGEIIKAQDMKKELLEKLKEKQILS